VSKRHRAYTVDAQGTPALHWAVRVDDADLTRLLLSSGADAKLANRYGMTPLTLAVTNGNPTIIRLLLDAGADANALGDALHRQAFEADLLEQLAGRRDDRKERGASRSRAHDLPRRCGFRITTSTCRV